MLRIEHATLNLGGKTLFRDFDLHVDAGELVCLTGESGCGKTSLLKAVMGFVALNEGSVTVNGWRLGLKTVAQIRQFTAYVPQELSLPHETVEEMVRMPFDLKANKHIAFSKKRLWHYWDMLGLSHDLYESKTSYLSGGQRQRILLSVGALLGRKLIMADEPTSALDTDSMKRVIAFFRELVAEGAAVLTVSHDRDFMAGCDRVVRL